jgi:hypothetical protein
MPSKFKRAVSTAKPRLTGSLPVYGDGSGLGSLLSLHLDYNILAIGQCRDPVTEHQHRPLELTMLESIRSSRAAQGDTRNLCSMPFPN